MTESKNTPNPLFNPGKARWLQEQGEGTLDEDQQALLLALAQLESELGRELSEEESAALESLSAHMEGFDPQLISDAVHQMVQKPADPSRKTKWPEFKHHKE
jgi:hypothetical protein